ncbi:MAG: DUF2934 domain-containing protein [Methylobacter sp.]
MKAANKLIPIAKNGSMDAEKFQKMIAERAYFKALKRGFAANFAANHELEDWLEAEKEVSNQYFYWFIEV